MGGYFSFRKKGKGAWMKLLSLIFLIYFTFYAFGATNKEDILFQEGLYHYQKGRYDLAIKAFSSVIEICPTYPKIEEMLISSIKKRAETLKTEKKTQEEPKQKKLEEQKPLTYEPYKDILILPEKETKTLTHDEDNYLFGRKLISFGMNEEGIGFLEAILKEKAKIGFADKILFTIGEAKRDPEIINKLLKEYPKTALKYEAKLLVCNLSKDYKKAIVGFMELIKDLSNGTITIKDPFPHLPPSVRDVDEIIVECQMGLGNAYKELGDYPQSIVEYKKVVDEYPKMKRAPDALFYIADMYDRYPKTRDFLKAIEFYGRLIREYPDSIWKERAKTRKRYIEENYL